MMNVTDYTNIKTLLIKFKQKSDVLYAKASALSNYATIEWVGTQIPSVGNGTVTIKQNGTSKGSFSMNQSEGATINLTDTIYSSLSAVSGGTNVSLVTTGEKYTWNSKQAAISDLSTIRSNAATAYGWGDHSKAGYITGITKAMVESVLTGNITSHTHTFASLTSKPTTLSGYGIVDANRIFKYTIPASGNKGVRITFAAHNPVKITVSGSDLDAQLMLIGTGYGAGGFSRNNFTELVQGSSRYTWCLSEEKYSVEVFSNRAAADMVTVESPSPITFTPISALSKPAVSRHLLTTGNYSSYVLPLTGGTIRGSIRMDGTTLAVPLIRNFRDTFDGGWARSVLECRVDDKNAFKITGFGHYTPGAANNKMQYVSLGFAEYDGLNLRISDTSLTWGDSDIYHAGNSNKSNVNWACKALTAAGLISTASWCKADRGFYTGYDGVYFTRIGNAGEIDMVKNDVFIWGSSTGKLRFNYVAANNRATVVTDFIWHAGSSTSYATHTMGPLTVIGGITATTDITANGIIYAKTGMWTNGYISAKQASTSSDKRLKTDFRSIDNALDYILGTHYTRFRWKDDNKESIGIIAQEEQGREYGFLVQNHEKIGHLTYDYAASTALLGAAIQEEDSKVERLKKRIEELENELSNLKKTWLH